MRDEFVLAIFPQSGQVAYSTASQQIMDALGTTAANLILKVKARTILTFRTGISFCLDGTSNYCRIDLDDSNTYAIRFAKVAYFLGDEFHFCTRVRKRHLDAATLRRVFEVETGVILEESRSSILDRLRQRGVELKVSQG